MVFSETLLFAISLTACLSILFLLIYFVITLTDLECDYLNAQECCDKLNYWMLPKFIVHSFTTFILLYHFRLWLFLCNLPMFIWLTFHYLTIPTGDLGAYDPIEILNSRQLRRHMRNVLIKLAYYFVMFFMYLYCFILAILKSNPVPRQNDDEFITEIKP